MLVWNFCFRNVKNAAEGRFGDQALSKTTTFDQWKIFTEGREGVEDKYRPERPSTFVDEEYAKKIEDQSLNIVN